MWSSLRIDEGQRGHEQKHLVLTEQQLVSDESVVSWSNSRQKNQRQTNTCGDIYNKDGATRTKYSPTPETTSWIFQSSHIFGRYHYATKAFSDNVGLHSGERHIDYRVRPWNNRKAPCLFASLRCFRYPYNLPSLNFAPILVIRCSYSSPQFWLARRKDIIQRFVWWPVGKLTGPYWVSIHRRVQEADIECDIRASLGITLACNANERVILT